MFLLTVLEMNVIYDSDSQDQMVPPPYDAQIHKKNDTESVGKLEEQAAGDDRRAALHISTSGDTERPEDAEIPHDKEIPRDIDRSLDTEKLRDTEQPRDPETSDDPNTGIGTEPAEASTEGIVEFLFYSRMLCCGRLWIALKEQGVHKMAVFDRHLKQGLKAYGQ